MKLIFVFTLLAFSKVNSLFVITYIKINATNRITGQSVQVCGNVQPPYGSISSNYSRLDRYELLRLQSSMLPDERRLCKRKKKDLGGKVLLDGYPYNKDWLLEGCNPNFYNDTLFRINISQELNISAVLFRHYETYAGFYVEELNASYVQIPIYFINDFANNEIEKLYNYDKNRSNEIDLKFLYFEQPTFEAAMIIMLIIAMICIILGGLWSGYTHQQLYLFHLERKRLKAEVVPSITVGEPSIVEEQTLQKEQQHLKSGFSASVEPPAQPFNWCTLGFFVILIVGFLLLLYYFHDFLIWFLIAVYTIASGSAVYNCLSFLMDKLCRCATCGINLVPMAECLEKCTRRDWSAFKYVLEYRKIVLFICSMSFAIVWCIYRQHPYVFIMHNILSTFFSIYLIHQMRLPNLMWITVLLSAMLLYDLFMVFITPYFTKGGCSIMVEVATGGACSSQGIGPPDPNKQELPILFKIPRFNDPVISCFNLTIDLQYPPVMLGLGDVILPGMLVGFNFAFDLGWNTKYRVYYVTAVIGYFVGMVVTFLALIYMKMAQPALIYLVPCTLIPTHVVAAFRKQWLVMWKGHYPWVEELNPMLDPSSPHHLQTSVHESAGRVAPRAESEAHTPSSGSI